MVLLPRLLTCLTSELVGSCLLTAATSISDNQPTTVAAIYAVLISLNALIDYGHLNPAVTIGVIIKEATQKTLTCYNILQYATYILMQYLGSFFGALLAWGLTGELLQIKTSADDEQVFFAITIFTGVFVGAYLNCRYLAFEEKPISPLFVAVALYLGLKSSFDISGGYLNSCSEFGIKLVRWGEKQTEDMEDYWLYFLASITGGMIGGLIWFIFTLKKDLSKEEHEMQVN